MMDVLSRGMPLAAGLLLGAVFFGGLWWTVRKIISSKWPSVWLLGSLVVRTSLVLTGFYFVAHGRSERLLLCLLGFVMARLIVIRITRTMDKSSYLLQEPARAT